MLDFTFNGYYLGLFPLSLLAFYGLKRLNPTLALPFLTVISIAFLAVIDVSSLLLLSTLVLLNYSYIRTASTRSEPLPAWLKFGLVFINLSPLLLFKSGWFLPADQSSSSMTVQFNAFLPFGLAFYTLQQLTALLEPRPRTAAAPPSLHHYLLFSFCFITLPAGPVLNWRQAQPQYQQLAFQPTDYHQLAKGISLFIIGLAKFSFIAQPLEQYLSLFLRAANELSMTLTFTESLYTLLAGLLTLYVTFSAYSDMAIGMGLCFGLVLPVNFDSPLQASSIGQYINNWHMSFIAFVREYVFQPAFKLAKNLPIANMETRLTAAWATAVFCTFFTTAVWHSVSSWAVLQGAVIAAILVAIELYKRLNHHTPQHRVSGLLGAILSKAFLLITVFTTGLFFYAPTSAIAFGLIGNILSPDVISLDQRLVFLAGNDQHSLIQFSGFFPSIADMPRDWWSSLTLVPGWAVVHMVFTLGLIFAAPNSMQLFSLIPGRSIATQSPWSRFVWQPTGKHAFVLAIIFVLALGLMNTEQGFVYG